MSWSNAYVGLPYADLGRNWEGCDCWGLLRLVYERELGIQLPAYVGAYASAEERAEIEALVAAEEPTGPWARVTRGRPFDAILFRQGRYRAHVGILIDSGLMLHMAGEQAKVESWGAPRWRSRLTGLYRHRATDLEGGLQ